MDEGTHVDAAREADREVEAARYAEESWHRAADRMLEEDRAAQRMPSSWDRKEAEAERERILMKRQAKEAYDAAALGQRTRELVGSGELQVALDEAVAALEGHSNDAEHDALAGLVGVFGRSWTDPEADDQAQDVAAAERIIREQKEREEQPVPEGGAYSTRTYAIGRLAAQLTPREQIVSDVLTTAVEGGIGYWSQADRIVRATDGSVVAVVLYPDDPDEDTWEPKRIELHHVEAALVELATVPRGGTPPLGTFRALLAALHEPGIVDEPDYDADDADCIVQVAAFGKIVYG